MTLFLLNIILALIWMFVHGQFTFGTFVIGVLLGYLIIALVSPAIDNENYVRRVLKTIYLIGFFIKELFISSLQVARDVIKPGAFTMQSGVIALPLESKSDLEITLLANMISLTPGTLSLDVSDDRTKLYIHAMYVDQGVDAVKNDIKNGMERNILEVTRVEGAGKRA